MIQVRMLGTPFIKINQESIVLPYKKVEGLLYYLCYYKSITRDDAVNIFWASMDEKKGRRSLRDAIYRIKKIFGNDFLQISGYTKIHLNPQVSLQVDLDTLDEDNLQDGYTGDFLDGFYLKNCYEFEVWQEKIRKEYKTKYVESLRHQIQLDRDNTPEKFTHYAMELIASDKYCEENYCLLMQIYARKGQYKLALDLYKQLSEILEEELEEEPSGEVEKLYSNIQKLAKAQGDEDAVYEHHVGERTQLLYETLEQINQFKEGQASSILFCGDIGSGKTDLLSRLKQLVENEKEIIVLEHNCFKAEKDITLLPWHDMLVQLKARQAYSKGGVLSKKNSLQPESAFAFEGQERIVQNTLYELRTYLQNGKVILLIDDLHWLDFSSKTLLSSIMLQLGMHKIMLIATVCSEGELDATTFFAPLIERKLLIMKRLPELNKLEEETIIQRMLPQAAADRSMIEKIIEKSEGNPLFLMEIIDTIRQGKDIDIFTERMTGALSSMFHELSGDEKEFLNALSLFDGEAGLAEMHICIRKEEMELYLVARELLSKKLIYEIEEENKVRYSFTRKSLCKYIYGALPAGEKVVKHHSIARYYESLYNETHSRQYIPKMVDHFRQCGNLQNAYQYQLLYLDDISTLYFEPYPRLFGKISADLLNRDSTYYQENIQEIVDAIGQLHLDNEENIRLHLYLAFILGRYDLYIGEAQRGMENIRRALELAKQLGDAKKQAHIISVLIMQCTKTSNLEMMRVYVEEMEQLVNSYGIGIEGYALCLKGCYYIQEKQYSEALILLAKALEYEKICDEEGNYCILDLATCYSFIGDCYYNMQQFELALRHYDHAIRLCNPDYMFNCYGIFYTKAGRACYQMGNRKAAYRYLKKALQLFAHTKELWWYDIAQAYMARIKLQENKILEAQRHLNHATELMKINRHPGALRLVESVRMEIEQKLVNS